jgi:GntR family transcriptional regulator
VSRDRNSGHGSRPHLFHYNATAGIPAYVQLEEQVKVALALGKLRPGDVLPSIRNVEDELGVGRMLVRKAYQRLQDAGLLRIIHGRGAVVTGQARTNGRVIDKAEAMILRLVPELRREGLDPVTFSRILHQRLLEDDARAPRLLCVDSSEVLARELGQQIQESLGVHVRSSGIARLQRTRKSVTAETQVLVDYYYLTDVRRILAGRMQGIYPISLDYDPAFVERVTSLPLGSDVLLLFYASSLKETGTLLAIDALLDRVKDRKFRIDTKAIERAGRLDKLARSKYEAVIVSNRVWDVHGPVLERHPKKFLRLASRVNHQSLDAIRDRLGFVL